jgi:hypothetical protein
VPIYTVRKANSDSGHEWTLQGSYDEIKSICEEDGLEIVLKPVGFISSQEGSTRRKAGGEWNNFLQRVDKGAGRNSKVKT